MLEKLSVEQILNRYIEEDLPEFSEIELTDVNQIGNFGNTLLHVACIRGVVEEVVALLNGGAYVNAIGELGNTPLHDAVGQGHVGIVRILLKTGASPTIQNDFNETALELANARGSSEIVDLINRKDLLN